MRIDPSLQYLGNLPPEGVGNTTGQPKIAGPQAGTEANPASSTTEGGDTVQFSGTLSEAQQLKAQLAQTPDARASRVAALQQQVQQGTYRPSNEQIANAMLAELFGASSPSGQG